MAHSSLYFYGNAELKIFAKDFSRSEMKSSFYNIYSIKRIKKLLYHLGYKKFAFNFMNLKEKLPKPTHSGMGSYTVKFNKKKIIMSGPLLLPQGYFYSSWKTK